MQTLEATNILAVAEWMELHDRGVVQKVDSPVQIIRDISGEHTVVQIKPHSKLLDVCTAQIWCCFFALPGLRVQVATTTGHPAV